jgi:transcriptional regulator
MYVPSHFAMSEDDVHDLLAEHGAGDLVTFSADEGLVATMLPFVHDPADGGWGSLHGHVARVNDQWKQQVTGEALVILRGPDAYVSPGWYPSKQEHGRVVPTWNYVSAHVYGELVVHDDAEYTRRLVEALTAKHEAVSARPWSVEDAPAGYIDGQLRAVVGVELRITRIEAKTKASQNRPPADADGVVDGLRRRGQSGMADEVARRGTPR